VPRACPWVSTLKAPIKGWAIVNEQYIFGYYICGELNAKNRMGGYAGVVPWYVFVRNDQVIKRLISDWGSGGARGDDVNDICHLRRKKSMRELLIEGFKSGVH